MSRKLATLSTLAVTLAATACATDVVAPHPDRAGTSPAPALALLPPIFGYQATVLSLDFGAAINAAGDVVGTENGKGVHYRYASGAITALALSANVNTVTPVDITTDGRILARGNGSQGPKALFYHDATATPIDIAAPRWAEPTSMNDDGIAVGRWGNDRGWGAFRWSPDAGIADITPGGFDLAWPFDISAKGYIAGIVQLVNDVNGFRWNAGGLSGGAALPTGLAVYQALDGGGVLVRDPVAGSAIWTLGGTTPVGPDPVSYHVERISPIGRLVGSVRDQKTRALTAWTSYNSTTPVILPTPTGFAEAWAIDVNGCGTILGRGKVAATGELRAIIWARSFTCDIGPATTGK